LGGPVSPYRNRLKFKLVPEKFSDRLSTQNFIAQSVIEFADQIKLAIKMLSDSFIAQKAIMRAPSTSVQLTTRSSGRCAPGLFRNCADDKFLRLRQGMSQSAHRR